VIGGVAAWLSDPVHWSGPDGVPARLLEHLGYAVIAVVLGFLIAFPLGVLIGHTGRGTFLVAGAANAFRALPTLGLLILLVLLLSGALPYPSGYRVPAVVVLVLLAIPPILSGTYSGIANVDPAVRDAAYGMGMTGGAVALRLEVPVSFPLILGGIRSAFLQVVATATVVAYVSLGGLGRFILDGLSQRDYAQMASGALLVALLAIVLDLMLAGVQRLFTKPGLSTRPAS